MKFLIIKRRYLDTLGLGTGLPKPNNLIESNIICYNIMVPPPKDLPNSMLLQTLLATFASQIVQRSVGRILDPD